MKKFTFILLAILLSGSIFAKKEKTQDRANTTSENIALAKDLSGLVIDKVSNEFLVGVEVSIEGTDLKTYTDFDGRFTFENLRPGKYKLVSSYISYNMVVTEVDNLDEASVKIELDAVK